MQSRVVSIWLALVLKIHQEYYRRKAGHVRNPACRPSTFLLFTHSCLFFGKLASGRLQVGEVESAPSFGNHLLRLGPHVWVAVAVAVNHIPVLAASLSPIRTLLIELV